MWTVFGPIFGVLFIIRGFVSLVGLVGYLVVGLVGYLVGVVYVLLVVVGVSRDSYNHDFVVSPVADVSRYL